ncbi:MAG: sulfatase-like hydrolase/transferase [Planctomycetota bacterium]|jgi:choline-sulfatase
MNFIYFNPDEMRADLLGCYGHPLAKTPNLDRFAAEGVRFNQCHVQHTVCTPSRCSFMTGWYPHTRGHRTLFHSLRPDEPNTLKYLKQNGYDVHWIGKNDLLAVDSFPESVTRVHAIKEPEGPVGSRETPDRDDPHFRSFLHGPMTSEPREHYQLAEAVDFLKSRKPGDNPFMLYLPWGQPHCPYTVPEPWYSMYKPEDVPPLRPADLPNMPEFHALIRKYRDLDKLDDLELRRIMAVYLGMISYVDHLFGELLKALEETGLEKDTTVFFFSDHGDWAGDYGLVEKWPSGLDDCLTRVPMIVRSPGCTAGHVVAEPIECFDIMPTTLELAGIEVDHHHWARSMMPQLKGAAGDPERAAFAEGGYDTHELHCFEGKSSGGDDFLLVNKDGVYYPKGLQQQEERESVCRSAMIRTATHKLTRRTAGQNELYDLVADPRELSNLYGQPAFADVQLALTERLLEWYIATSDSVPFDTDPRGFQPEMYS